MRDGQWETDGRTDGEGASGIGAWDGRAARPALGCGAVGHGAAADKRVARLAMGHGALWHARQQTCTQWWKGRGQRAVTLLRGLAVKHEGVGDGQANKYEGV